MLKKPNFTEDYVAIFLEAYLSYVGFPFRNWTIIPFSKKKETQLGVDAKLTSGASFSFSSFYPFYMQFKRPHAYPHTSTKSSVVSDRSSFSPALKTNPYSLFFRLRERKSPGAPLQHNVLLTLKSRINALTGSDAAYVCPLFLEKGAYKSSMLLAARIGWFKFFKNNPFNYNDVVVNNAAGSITVKDIPELANHVSIPPHIPVASHLHRYSFFNDGSDICFHSKPNKVDVDSPILMDWLDGIVEKANDDSVIIKPDSGKELFHNFFTGITYDIPHLRDEFKTEVTDDSWFGDWLNFGDFLENEYGIKQYAVVKF